MMAKKVSGAAILGLFAAGLVPVIGGAQQAAAAAPGDSSALEEVVVTAEKRSERLQDVPVAMTVVSAAQLDDQHVTSIADLAHTTPSLEIIQSFGGPGGGGQIRGIGTTSFTRSAEGAVGIVVDGVSQGNVNANNIFDTAQVEVLRGPQGTLFGLTSSAGVINMTTNAPDPSKFATIWHADFSNKGTAGSEFGQQTVHGVVNIPLTPDSALRIAGSLDDYKGVQHNSYTGRDDTSSDYALRARYLLNATDKLKLNVIADYQRAVVDGAQGGPVGGTIAAFTYVYADPALTAELAACGITPGFGNQDRCAQFPEHYYDTSYGLSAQLDWDLGDNTLTSITAYRRDESGPNDQDVQAEPLESPHIWSGGGLTASRLYSEELRIASHAGAQLEYTAGAFYSNYLTLGYNVPTSFFHLQPLATPYFPPAPPGFGPPPGTALGLDFGFPQTTLTQTTTDSAAAFGQVTYHATDQLAFIAGARYTYESIGDYQSPLGLMPGAAGDVGAFGQSVTQSNFSGKLGAQYKFTHAWTGYATVTRGYKGPQAQAATSTSPAVLIPAEIPLSFEIGLKGETLDHALGVDFSVFDTRVQNYQGQTCNLSPIGLLICLPNSFDVTTKGVELDLYGHPLPHLSLNGGFIYDEATYPSGYLGLDPNNLTGAAFTRMGGLQLVGVPKTKLTLSADYTIPFGPVSGFIGADSVYKSDVRDGYSADPRFVYPAHWVVGLRIGVRSSDEHWGVTAFARDVNNAHEPITLFGGPAYSAPAPYGPFFNPSYPNGQVSGISGWIGSQSLREVGLSFDLKF